MSGRVASVDDDSYLDTQAGFFDAFRFTVFPTLYGAMYIPVTADVLEAGFIFAACILAFSLYITLPGFRKYERITAFIRMTVAVYFLVTIMVINFGQEWEVAEIHTKTQYRAHTRREINATVGVKIGLRSINITLKGDPQVVELEEHRVNETINYNERFKWDDRGWLQGRAGFGPNAGLFNREFRAAQRRGLPYPILWVAEYFTLDGEGVRWGRHYRQAGYYVHILMWTALPAWILSMILYNMVPRYGAYFTLLTCACFLLSNIVYASVRNAFDLKIPFEEDVLTFHWGWCFWLCLINGIICFLISVVVLILDYRQQEKLADFFNVDITQDWEEGYIADDDNEPSRRARTRRPLMSVRVRTDAGPSSSAGASNGNASAKHDDDDDDDDDTPQYQARPNEIQHVFRKRTIAPRIQATKKVKQRPVAPTPPQAYNGQGASGFSNSAMDDTDYDDVKVTHQGEGNVRFETQSPDAPRVPPKRAPRDVHVDFSN